MSQNEYFQCGSPDTAGCLASCQRSRPPVDTRETNISSPSWREIPFWASRRNRKRLRNDITSALVASGKVRWNYMEERWFSRSFALHHILLFHSLVKIGMNQNSLWGKQLVNLTYFTKGSSRNYRWKLRIERILVHLRNIRTPVNCAPKILLQLFKVQARV